MTSPARSKAAEALRAAGGVRPLRRWNSRAARNRSGFALLATMIAVSLTTLVAAGIGTLLLAHNDHGVADQNAARALDLAECAAQFQFQRLMATQALTQVAYTGSNLETATYGTTATPMPVTTKQFYAGLGPGSTSLGTGTLNDSRFLGLNTSGSNPDYCIAWIGGVSPDPDSPPNLNSTNGIYIYGKAQVNGVWREVRMLAAEGSLFDQWAVFGDQSVSIGGSCSVTPTTGSTLGYVASNTLISLKKPGAVGGQIVYGSGVPDSDLPAYYGGPTYVLPTINSLAIRAYADGGYPAHTGTTGIHLFAGSSATATNNDNYAYGTVGGTTTHMSATGGSSSFPIYLQSKSSGAAANFYLLSLSGSNITVYANVANGPINLWVDDSSSGGSWQGNVNIIGYSATDSKGNPSPTLNDSKKFHLFYSCPNGTLSIKGGGSTKSIYAMLYNYNNNASNVDVGDVDTTGTVIINGAIAASVVSGSGNFTVNYPSGIAPTDAGGLRYFSMRGHIQELNPARGD